jgi:hypothetical protein
VDPVRALLQPAAEREERGGGGSRRQLMKEGEEEEDEAERRKREERLYEGGLDPNKGCKGRTKECKLLQLADRV